MHPNPLVPINNYIRDNSGYDTHRQYLGMSGINGCPRILYTNFLTGTTPSEISFRNAYRGYMFEREVKKILTAVGLFVPGSEKTLNAPWDKRFEGHTDGEDPDGDLVELKSVNSKAFAEIKESGKLRHREYWQVQSYMLYGPYAKGTTYFINTET